MKRSLRDTANQGPPPVVFGLLALELVAAVILILAGIPWPAILAGGAPLVTLTFALLSPTVQELGRRQPRLSLATSEGEDVAAPAERPWPIDTNRIVSNEAAEARESAKRKRPAFESMLSLQAPFARRPSEAELERSKEEFEEKVVSFEEKLRTWLSDYRGAARVHADTFVLTIVLRNAGSGAFAEAVSVVLELPESVEFIDELPKWRRRPSDLSTSCLGRRRSTIPAGRWLASPPRTVTSRRSLRRSEGPEAEASFGDKAMTAASSRQARETSMPAAPSNLANHSSFAASVLARTRCAGAPIRRALAMRRRGRSSSRCRPIGSGLPLDGCRG